MRPTCRKAWWTGGGGGTEAAGRRSLCRGSLSWANLGGVDAAILPGRGRGPPPVRGPGPSPAALLRDRTEQSWSGGSPGPTHSPARRPTWSISCALGGPWGDRTLVPPHPAPGNPQSRLRWVERVWGRCEPGAGRALWAAWLETSAAGQSNQPRGEAPSLAGERPDVGWMQGGGWRSRRGLRPGDMAHVFLYF